MSSTTTTAPGATAVDRPGRPGLVLFMVCAAIFMLMLDTTVVSAALADIREHFNTSIDGLQWVVDGYSIPLAGAMLTLATVGDRFGRKKLFVTGMGVFTAASLVLTLANGIVMLDILRAVQGVGAAMLFAVALPLLSVAYPAAHARAKAIGVYGAVMAGATVLGPVIGGALVTRFGWRSIFTVNVPIGVFIAVLATMKMPETVTTRERPADWPGSLLLTGGLVAGVLGITRSNALGFTSGPVLTLLGLGAVLLVAFLVRQTRAAHPLFDISMARKPGFSGTAIISVAHMATLMAASNYLALFLIGTLGYSPLQMGLRLLPISVGAMIAAPVTAIYAKRVPNSVSMPATMALVTVGMYLLGGIGHDGNWTYFLPGMIVGGIGLGALTAANQAASLTFASQEDAGMASATFGTLRQVGMAVGIAGLGAVFSHEARHKATEGLATVPGTDKVPQDLKDQFVHQVGSGSGHQVVGAVPKQFHDSVPALTHVADNASIDALNSLTHLGWIVGAASVVAALVSFAIDRGRVGRQRREAEPEPTSA